MTGEAKKRHRRAGVILAAVLATLMVAMLLAGALVQAVTRAQRAQRLAEQDRQAFWLAESAVQRALAALADASDYRGETWKIAADVFGEKRGAEVTIRVEQRKEDKRARSIVVQARYPLGAVSPILYRRKLQVQLPAAGEKP